MPHIPSDCYAVSTNSIIEFFNFPLVFTLFILDKWSKWQAGKFQENLIISGKRFFDSSFRILIQVWTSHNWTCAKKARRIEDAREQNLTIEWRRDVWARSRDLFIVVAINITSKSGGGSPRILSRKLESVPVEGDGNFSSYRISRTTSFYAKFPSLSNHGINLVSRSTHFLRT